MSETSTLHSPRLVVLTALIGAATTIAASLVAVFPQIIHSTPAQTDQTNERKVIPAPPAEKWSVRGQVVDRGGRPVENADVVLVPVTGQNIQNTNTDGSFEFSGVPAEPTLLSSNSRVEEVGCRFRKSAMTEAIYWRVSFQTSTSVSKPSLVIKLRGDKPNLRLNSFTQTCIIVCRLTKT